MAELYAALRDLAKLTDNKIEHLKDILDITYKQKEAVYQQNIDILTKYVKEKQQHIDAIDKLDEEFQSIYDGIRDELKSDKFEQEMAMSAEETGLYREFKQKVQEVQNIVKVICGVEKENNENVNRIMEELKGKIRSINAAKRGYKAYKSVPAMTDGVFIDKKR